MSPKFITRFASLWNSKTARKALGGIVVSASLCSPVWAQQPRFSNPSSESEDAAWDASEGVTSDQEASPYREVNANSKSSLEARLRDLEYRYDEQSERLASMTRALQDKKADAKGDDKKEDKVMVVGSDLKMNGAWKDGGQVETSDKAFRLKWRGRTQFDVSGFTHGSQPHFQGLGGNLGQPAVDFRRLRLGTEGTLYDQYDFAVELDFINSFNTNGSTNAFAPNNNLKNAFDRQFFGVPAPTDVWVGMHEVPLVGNFRLGNIKPANGLEHANSSRFLDFMERSLNQDAFTGRFNNGFQPGVLFFNNNSTQTATFQASVAKNTYNVFAYDAGSPGWDYAGRVTWTPIFDEPSHGRFLMHLGFSTTFRTTTDGQERIRVRSSLRNGISQSWSNVADTTIFFSDKETLLIPEIAAVYGPLHLQAEYFGQFNNNVRIQGPGAAINPGPNLGTAYFQGYYAQASLFLTGEHREYDRKLGCFGRVIPFTNFHLIKSQGRRVVTSGAWQILYRYCLLDLNDPRLANVNFAGGGAANVGGGVIYDHTIGLNHFLNPNMKMQYNFVIANRTPSAATPIINPQVGGLAYGFGGRLAIDF